MGFKINYNLVLVDLRSAGDYLICKLVKNEVDKWFVDNVIILDFDDAITPEKYKNLFHI